MTKLQRDRQVRQGQVDTLTGWWGTLEHSILLIIYNITNIPGNVADKNVLFWIFRNFATIFASPNLPFDRWRCKSRTNHQLGEYDKVGTLEVTCNSSDSNIKTLNWSDLRSDLEIQWSSSNWSSCIEQFILYPVVLLDWYQRGRGLNINTGFSSTLSTPPARHQTRPTSPAAPLLSNLQTRPTHKTNRPGGPLTRDALTTRIMKQYNYNQGNCQI